MKMRCMKCKDNVNVSSTREVKFKKNSRTGKRAIAATGECPRCGTQCFRILRQE